MSLHLRSLTGADIAGVIPDLAQLRVTVFRDWPYLYDGDAAYEARYLAAYRDNPRAVIVAAFDGDALVGAATGLPLSDADPDFARAIKTTPHAPEDLFYCAESVLLPNHRGQGAGHRFFDLREAHARALGFTWACFCAVIRPDDHPARPARHRPLDPFWRARGYAPLPGAIAHFGWRDRGDRVQTDKPMQFWVRRL